MARQLTLTRDVTFVIETCSSCGVEFGITVDFEQAHRRDGGRFYCPNGHSLLYKGGENDRLRQRVKELEAQKTHLADQRDAARADVNRLAVQSAQAELAAKRQRRRAAAGVCPCCGRTFQQLVRHMSVKHPGFVEEARRA